MVEGKPGVNSRVCGKGGRGGVKIIKIVRYFIGYTEGYHMIANHIPTREILVYFLNSNAAVYENIGS